MKEKIGVGIVTCDRPDFLEKLIKSVEGCDYIDEFVIVNDGSPLPDIDIPFAHTILQNKTNLSVGVSKNRLMEFLLESGCDYIFIVEDDMLIKDSNIFKYYINAYKETGIHHMMFGYHGPANKGNISKGKPKPRKIIDYNNIQIALNQHCVGAFCFYTSKCLKDVGLNNEQFNKNNFEHVEHSYRLAKAGYSTPYWWWSDLANSSDYIEEQACVDQGSAIRKGDWQDHIKSGALLFKEIHGYLPAWKGCVPDVPFSEVLTFLKNLKK